MTHEERMEIAREVTNAILAKYGEIVTVVALYGSVAKGEDTAHSDIDLWVATDTRQSIEDTRFFVYRGIAVSVNWDTEEGRIRSAGHVTPFWPMDADELRSYIVLFEREGSDFLQRLNEAISNVRDEDFLAPMRVLMVRLYETTNKLRNAWDAQDHYRLLVEGRALALGTAMVLGLLNKRYYPGGRGFYQISKQMPRQPEEYSRLVDLAGGFVIADDHDLYTAGMRLWANLRNLIGAEGVVWESGELPF